MRRRCYAALLLLPFGGCAGAAPTPARGSSSEARECSARIARARAALEAGKLWSARRALAGSADCSGATGVLVEANLGLGKRDEAARLLAGMSKRDAKLGASLRELERIERARKPASDASLTHELAGIKGNLAQGQCAEAYEGARRSFERWTPNPKALLLAASAAECQGDTTGANRLYARAAAEFENSSGLRWVELDTMRPSEFRAPHELLVRLGDSVAVLSVGSHAYEPATLTPVSPEPARSLWSDDEVGAAVQAIRRAGVLGARVAREQAQRLGLRALAVDTLRQRLA